MAVTAIHPDLLGLLCLIIFYPFVGERVVFPMPVSPRLEEAFRNPNFRRQFRFDNVDSSVEMYSGSEMALSFGGGSTPAPSRTMFPEAYVVHEAHWQQGRLVPSDTHRVVHDMGLGRGRVVATNQRYVSRPGGWHGWTCSLATTLLMATDRDFGVILMGSTLGGTLLRGGNRVLGPLQGQGLARNHRELLAVRIQLQWECRCSLQSAEPAPSSPWSSHSTCCGPGTCSTARSRTEVHAVNARNGLRRDVVRAVVDPGHYPQWAPYDNQVARAYLEGDPLTHGHVFSFARSRVNGLPKFIRSRLKDLQKIESAWPLRVHTGTFDFCDDRWRPTIQRRVLEHLDPMRQEDVAEMETWNATRRARHRGGRRFASMKRRAPRAQHD